MYTGWYSSVNNSQPFDVEIDYEIFDEGFETEIGGITVQAAHHPHHDDRPEELSPPDPRASNQEKELDPNSASPEELFEMRKSKNFIDNLFSVKRHTNENTDRSVPSLRDIDMAVYNHVHMAYPRTVYGTMVIGTGARRNGHQLNADCMPERSLHLSSFSDDYVHELHFDADLDDIFEHLAFDRNDNYKRYEVPIPLGETHSSAYKPLQARFNDDQISDESHEDTEDLPPTLSL